MTRGNDGPRFRPMGAAEVTIRLADGVAGEPRAWRVRLGDDDDVNAPTGSR